MNNSYEERKFPRGVTFHPEVGKKIDVPSHGQVPGRKYWSVFLHEGEEWPTDKELVEYLDQWPITGNFGYTVTKHEEVENGVVVKKARSAYIEIYTD